MAVIPRQPGLRHLPGLPRPSRACPAFLHIPPCRGFPRWGALGALSPPTPPPPDFLLPEPISQCWEGLGALTGHLSALGDSSPLSWGQGGIGAGPGVGVRWPRPMPVSTAVSRVPSGPEVQD